jgi:DNA repair protein RadD
MLTFTSPKAITLRPYQMDAVEALRRGIAAQIDRDERRRQIVVAPTGAGKTVIAAHLLRQASDKGRYALFLVDRVSLVDQTSATLDSYGIRHGVLQGLHHRYAPHEHVQVCSIQTLARRSLPRLPELIVYDEAHCIYEAAISLMDLHPKATCLGLTATPFTPSLGQHWGGVVNVTTTRKLIEDGFLVEPTIYIARSPEDAELGLNSFGEFSDKSAETAGIRIVGDVVEEWISKTTQHFGGPVKTIVFSPSVAHGREVCDAFAARGFNFQQISYLDRDDDARRVKIEEFRQPDSLIHGLVSCGVLTKGFDIADVRCGISCKPYRKSLSSHLQEIGRVMRPIIGESKKAIWLDHSGNIERFAVDMFDVWENGAGDLSSAEARDKKPRKRDETTRQAAVCPECSGAMRGASCMACGYERPARSGVVNVAGELHEFSLGQAMEARPGLRAECLSNPKGVYEAALAYSLAHGRDEAKARKRAYAIWRGVYPTSKPGFGWFDMAAPRTYDPNAYALVEREVARFRKNARRAA